MGDHTESFQVDFDPDVITYEQLLAAFWGEHSPIARQWSTQYAHIAFWADEAQKAAIERSARDVEAKLGSPVTTRVERLAAFHPAEDYHQKYYLRATVPVMREFEAMFGRDQTAFRESTAAARANGIIGGCADSACVADIDRLGLSSDAVAVLQRRAAGTGREGCAF